VERLVTPQHSTAALTNEQDFALRMGGFGHKRKDGFGVLKRLPFGRRT
jgi:hypothetical protein